MTDTARDDYLNSLAFVWDVEEMVDGVEPLPRWATVAVDGEIGPSGGRLTVTERDGIEHVLEVGAGYRLHGGSGIYLRSPGGPEMWAWCLLPAENPVLVGGVVP